MATPDQIAAGVPAGANIVAQVPDGKGGTLYLGSDGGVFATGGSRYQGGVNNLQGDTLAGQHQFGGAGSGIAYDPNSGGYRVVDNAGHEYDFGGAQYLGGHLQNPLAQNPAFLAFMRTSGLAADQAARDYANAVDVAQRTKAAALQEYDLTRGLDRTNQVNDMVNRGGDVSGGGNFADKMTSFDSVTGAHEGQINQDMTDAVNKAGQDYTHAIGDLTQKGTEQGFISQDDQNWNKFLTGEAQKYPDLSDKILGSGKGPAGTVNGGV